MEAVRFSFSSFMATSLDLHLSAIVVTCEGGFVAGVVVDVVVEVVAVLDTETLQHAFLQGEMEEKKRRRRIRE